MACFDMGKSHMKLFCFSCLLLIQACATVPEGATEKDDPIISALQQENRQLTNNQIAVQQSLEEIYKRLHTLDAEIGALEIRVQELAEKPEPILITPNHATPLSSLEAASMPGKTVSLGNKGEKNLAPSQERTEVKKSVIAKKKSTKSPATPEREIKERYDRAYAAYTDLRYDESLALFKDFIKQYPQHPLADNAQYWIGEIYYDIENYPSAILAFKEVVTNYGDANKAPDALLKIGYAYLALDDPNNAQLFFKRVIKNYPFSEAEAKARAKLKELQNL